MANDASLPECQHCKGLPHFVDDKDEHLFSKLKHTTTMTYHRGYVEVYHCQNCHKEFLCFDDR